MVSGSSVSVTGQTTTEAIIQSTQSIFEVPKLLKSAKAIFQNFIVFICTVASRK